MKQKTKILSLVLIPTLLVLASIPLVYADSVVATLTIGNTIPSSGDGVCDAITPSSGTTVVATCRWNITDPNGINDINLTSVNGWMVNDTNPEVVQVNSTVCANDLNDSAENTAQFHCNFTIYWWYTAGGWNVSLNGTDWNGGTFTQQNVTATIATLTAWSIVPATFDFGTLTASTDDQAATDNPLLINNTGNQNITEMNISANNLTGDVDGNELIYAGNFSMNDADAANGEQLGEQATNVTIVGAFINVGNPTDGQESIYVYADISTGLSTQQFSTTSTGRNWFMWGVSS